MIRPSLIDNYVNANYTEWVHDPNDRIYSSQKNFIFQGLLSEMESEACF